LIAYAIRAAEASTMLTNYLTTTDDDEIAETAASLGSPILQRPPELGRDDTEIVPVLKHTLEHAERQLGRTYDNVVLLQPTAPIRTGDDVDAVIELLAGDPAADSVISVYEVDDAHPARMYTLNDDGSLEPFVSEWERALRQTLPPLYHRNGSLYACRRELLMERGMIIGERKKAYVMPREYTANIDDEVDLLFVDLIVGLWKEGRL
jgi:CMP-N-acetylneuraminic acid synthetase